MENQLPVDWRECAKRILSGEGDSVLNSHTSRNNAQDEASLIHADFIRLVIVATTFPCSSVTLLKHFVPPQKRQLESLLHKLLLTINNVHKY